jgi:hypothetical protein
MDNVQNFNGYIYNNAYTPGFQYVINRVLKFGSEPLSYVPNKHVSSLLQNRVAVGRR